MTKYDREATIRRVQADLRACLAIEVYEHESADGTLSAEWVRVSAQQLAQLASRLMDAADDLAHARAAGTAWESSNSALRADLDAAEQERDVLRQERRRLGRERDELAARAEKAELELREACADLATQRQLAGRMIVALERVRNGAGYTVDAHNGPAQRMMSLAGDALTGAE